jgi:hypothetical protein
MTNQLVTIKTLFDELNDQNIEYCIWKGNSHLDESLRGLTDLDLLVASNQKRHFKEGVYKHGCKRMISPSDTQDTPIEDYLGYDKRSGKLFHLHIYYQLILGGRFVRNYQLPLEMKFLSSAKKRKGLKIASPEMEIIVLAIRMLLKYRFRDVIKDILLIRSPGLSPKFLRQVGYLLQQTTFDRISKSLKSEISIVSPEIVLAFLKTASESPRSGWKCYRLRKDLRRDLLNYQLYSRWKASIKCFYALSLRRLPFFKSLFAKKRSVSRGILVALIGADGAGKSTVAEKLRQWLSWKLDAQVCYMGTGERLPFLSQALRFISRIFAHFHKASSKFVGQGNV